jgi:hypothetical protein
MSGDQASNLQPDPVILARIREAQGAIRRSLDAATAILATESIPLSIVTGSAILADFDLGDGVRRRAVSASILVPFPKAADDHQARNAASLADLGGAIAIRQEAADDTRLAAELRRLFGDEMLRTEMAEKARAHGKPRAAEDIASDLLNLAGIDADFPRRGGAFDVKGDHQAERGAA